MVFIDSWAESGCAAKHLLKQNTGFYPAHKYQRCYLRDVNSCGQQIYCNDDFRICLILETFDSLGYFLFVSVGYASGYFHNHVVRYPGFSVNFGQYFYDKVSV